MRVLVAGGAGFIGWKVTEFLLANGHVVVGVDNLNDAYDVRLKHWRLAQIKARAKFTFHRLDICDQAGLRDLFNSQFAIRNSTRSSILRPAPASANPSRTPGSTSRPMSPAR